MDTTHRPGGILIRAANSDDLKLARLSFIERATRLGIHEFLEPPAWNQLGVSFRLQRDLHEQLTPDGDTLELCRRLKLSSWANDTDLEKEILLAMLSGPVTFEYPSYPELAASVRIRQNIAKASRRTTLSFHTTKIERPADYWTHSEQTGFTLRPGKSLIEALRKATQPESPGAKYSFSCYRATEYVILLGIAQELVWSNPALLDRLERQWESKAIMSRQFHDVFTREFGSMDSPLPGGYYIPGDRLWFRNPDQRSADIMGYEGSWVIYLGNGLFSNFWDSDKPYTIASKCIEIYHWRNGAYQDAEGNLQMDESAVEMHVQATMHNPAEVEHILGQMMRIRDPQEVYADGGCLDASREYPRFVCPDTADLVLPITEFSEPQEGIPVGVSA